MKSNPLSHVWASEMTIDAQKIAKQAAEQWNGSLQSYVQQNEQQKVAPGVHIKTRQLAPETRPTKANYIGDPMSEPLPIVTPSEMPLDAYLSSILKQRLVKAVYITEDNREEDGIVSILIRLHRLTNMSPAYIVEENNRLIACLKTKKLEGATSVNVSFQYTEVY